MTTTVVAPTTPPRAQGRRTQAARQHARNATRIVVSSIGALIGVAGIEHGIGEILQGNVAPDGIAILSWPGSDAFRLLGGEPALTIVPNLLVTGILAIVISGAFLVWATSFVHRKQAGLVLLLLSIGMLLFGGGVAPPIVGIVLAAAASRINAPPTWWRSHVSEGVRRSLAMWWPVSLGVDLTAFLLLLLGSVILGAVVAADNPSPVEPALISWVVLAAFAFLVLSVVTAQARDSLRPTESVTGGST
jgi:hypothetical protein